MKRFLTILIAGIFAVQIHASEPFMLEDQAQEWVDTYARDKETGEFNLTYEEAELLANALFYSYRLVKLDELVHACNRITTYFHKVLPNSLQQEHQMILSPETVAAFAALMTHGKEDLQAAYAQAVQQFQVITAQLEESNNPLIVDAYNTVKKNAYANIEIWTKEEGVQLSQAALADLNEEQTKNLFNFALNFETTAEQAAQLLVDIPLKNLEHFFTFQTEAHAFIKSIWQTYLIALITSAETAGFKEIKLRVVQPLAKKTE